MRVGCPTPSEVAMSRALALRVARLSSQSGTMPGVRAMGVPRMAVKVGDRFMSLRYVGTRAVVRECPYCWLAVAPDDRNVIVKGRNRWHAPCWFLSRQPKAAT